MLASVYSYRVMVKSVSSCCVRGRWVLSDPVTFKDASVIRTIARHLVTFTKIFYAHHWKDTPEPKRTQQ